MLKLQHTNPSPKQDFFLPYFFTFYLSVSLIRFLNPANFFITSTLVLLGIAPLILFFNFKKFKFYNLFFIFLILAGLISSLYVVRHERIHHMIFFNLMSLGILLLFEHKLIFHKHMMFIFICLSLYFLSIIFSLEDPIYALKVCSGNGISIMMIVTTIALYISRYVSEKKILIWPAFSNFLICFWAGGRSGFFSSLIILIGVCYLCTKNKRIFLWSFFLFSTVMLFFSLVFFDYLKHVYFFKALFERFDNHSLLNDPRLQIWSNYFNNLDLSRFIFGVNFKRDPWPGGEILNFDYHNSFINLVAQTGLFGFFILLLTSYSLNYYLRKNFLYLILFLALIFRALTDSFIFFESWDFLFFFFLLAPLKSLVIKN